MMPNDPDCDTDTNSIDYDPTEAEDMDYDGSGDAEEKNRRYLSCIMQAAMHVLHTVITVVNATTIISKTLFRRPVLWALWRAVESCKRGTKLYRTVQVCCFADDCTRSLFRHLLRQTAIPYFCVIRDCMGY